MSEHFGNDFVSITDDEGNEFELEHLDTIEHGGALYMAFLPADMDEDDEDYGLVILRVLEEDGEELLVTVDDDRELEAVYGVFVQKLAEGDDVPKS